MAKTSQKLNVGESEEFKAFLEFVSSGRFRTTSSHKVANHLQVSGIFVGCESFFLAGVPPEGNG